MGKKTSSYSRGEQSCTAARRPPAAYSTVKLHPENLLYCSNWACQMEIVYLAILTFFAGILGTITGFGISTIMVPVVLLFLPLPQTLLLVGVIHWFGDIWKMYFFKHAIDWKLVTYFGIPGVIMAYFGASLVLSLPAALLSRFIGGVLIGYVIFLLAKPTFKLKNTPFLAAVGGRAPGF